MLKLYAWELAFAENVNDVRKQELETIRSQAYLNALVGLIWYCTPFLVSFYFSKAYQYFWFVNKSITMKFCSLQVSLAMFATYVLMSSDNYLTPDITFVTLLLINTLNWSMTFIPIFLTTAAQVSVFNIADVDSIMLNIINYVFDYSTGIHICKTNLGNAWWEWTSCEKKRKIWRNRFQRQVRIF